MTWLEELAKPFPKEDVKVRYLGGKALNYISIDQTINRLNEVLGAKWSFQIEKESIKPIFQEGKFKHYLAKISGTMSVSSDDYYVHRAGVGAGTNPDPDTAIKTALAEAIKKAGHQFGLGLYLWDEEVNNDLTEFRESVRGQTVGGISADSGTSIHNADTDSPYTV